MRLFSCQNCRQLVYFENVSCTRCGAVLGFLPDQLQLVALDPVVAGDVWRPLGGGDGTRHYRHCANRVVHDVCNWMVPVEDHQDYCLACRLNHTIPDLTVAGNMALWHRIETEKRRLIYSLLRLGLPVTARSDSCAGLAFDFLADTEPTFTETGRVFTGHADGLITLNVAEADPVVRERMRSRMAEPYRTILGHFRHESGHYYWERLVAGSDWLTAYRSMFGDERQDYQTALQNHYACGPAPGWGGIFVSAYASSHPWEDWAESWAHYLHIIDTLETAYQFGLEVKPRVACKDEIRVGLAFDPYHQTDFQAVIDHWLPLTYALNSLNRSMGHEHLYPFVLAAPVIDKLNLIHRIVQAASLPCIQSAQGQASHN
ncbi:MAG: hypothetical protein VR73_15465 [Gammaproteobacteria bacterium BRH_c0]|nr:MAG: hypothetical protein VR73_15465 [Gammaproteobacteria bacterium BRH_c0]